MVENGIMSAEEAIGEKVVGSKKVMWLVKGLGVGGVERLLATSVPYLNREDFSYEIAYLDPRNDSHSEYFRANGIPAFCLDLKNHLDLRVILRLRALLRERKPDLLEIHLPYPGIVGRIAGRLAGVSPILYVEHSLAVQIELRRLRILGFLGNVLTYRLNDLIVTVSEDTRREVEQYCFTKRPIQVVYNGIDLAKIDGTRANVVDVRQALGIPEGHKVVGHVANLLPKKRQEDLLKAAKRVLETFPLVTFVIVGRGPLDRKLRETAHNLGIQNNVIFAGFVDSLYEVMQTFDIFVMSSQYEGFGISLAEAMALGKPAVVTQVGGMPEVIEDKVSGLLAKPRAPADLACKILALLMNDDVRRTMGESAKRRVRQRFDIRRRVAAMEDIYRNLLGANEN